METTAFSLARFIISCRKRFPSVAVLASNDWSKFRPEMILIECYGSERGELLGGSAALLAEHGYEYFAKTVNTVFFRDGARSSAGPQVTP